MHRIKITLKSQSSEYLDRIKTQNSEEKKFFQRARLRSIATVLRTNNSIQIIKNESCHKLTKFRL